MSLKDEYDNSVSEIKTDQYSMSVGEIANMYKEGDLTIFPEYQRYFRWNIEQKSSFIESLILGIPTPFIFVSQDSDGNWDVIDGLQRISTILEFMGLLKNPETGGLYKPSKLKVTKFLPSLEDKYWEYSNNNIGPNFRRIIKRRKIDVIIIDSSNNSDIKYELFQRLNTNGEPLSNQEIRNVSILMTNPDLFNSINRIRSEQSFKNILKISPNKLSKQVDKDWISEFIVSLFTKSDMIDGSLDMGNMVTDKLVNVSKKISNDQITSIENRIIKTSTLLDDIFGENSFKKFNEEKNEYQGTVLQSMFEVVFSVTYNNYDYFKSNRKNLVELQKSIPTDHRYESATVRGIRSANRMKKMMEFVNDLGKEIQG